MKPTHLLIATTGYFLAITLLTNPIFHSNVALSVEVNDDPNEVSKYQIKLTYGETGTVSIAGIGEKTQREIEKRLDRDESIKSIVGIYTSPYQTDAIPILGKFSIRNGTLSFKPRFGLDSSQDYVVRILESKSRPYAKTIHASKKAVPSSSTVVSAIFPSSKTLPDNLLKFYFHFSKPMSRGEVYEHIELIDESGKKVDQPFLEIQQELWNRDQTRFTLLFDPGRIKQGLKPREEFGPPLVPNQKYTIRINNTWLDGSSKPLAKSFEHTFNVVKSDALQPAPKSWKIAAPKAQSKNPLTIKFDESLDHSMLQHSIEIFRIAAEDATSRNLNEQIDGSIEIDANETTWRLTPQSNWQLGQYEIRIDNRLEDVAGNSVGRPFEVDISGESKKTGSRPEEPAKGKPKQPKYSKLYFQIR